MMIPCVTAAFSSPRGRVHLPPDSERAFYAGLNAVRRAPSVMFVGLPCLFPSLACDRRSEWAYCKASVALRNARKTVFSAERTLSCFLERAVAENTGGQRRTDRFSLPIGGVGSAAFYPIWVRTAAPRTKWPGEANTRSQNSRPGQVIRCGVL